MIKISLFKLIVIMIFVFFSGYYLCSFHYKQKSERTEQIQAELRTDVHEIKRDFMPLMKSAVKTVEGYEEIIEQNRRYRVIPFVEMEEEL